jgi:hypothetical protein
VADRGGRRQVEAASEVMKDVADYTASGMANSAGRSNIKQAERWYPAFQEAQVVDLRPPGL